MVDLTEVKRFLGVEHTDDDALLIALEGYAASAIEARLGRRVVPVGEPADITEYHSGGGDHLVVFSPPIVSLTEVRDEIDGVDIPLDQLAISPHIGIIRYKTGGMFPEGAGRWKVRYTGGLELTEGLKFAILRYVADLYQIRPPVESLHIGDVTIDRGGYPIPPDVYDLIAPYRRIRL